MTPPTPAEFGAMRYFWEDLPVGFTWKTSSRTITEADVTLFASLTGDFNRAHVDAEFAAAGPFGQRIAHGLLIVAFMAGLNTRTIVNQLLEPSQLALLGVDTKFLRPTFIGDTIHVAVEVAAARTTSKPGRGVLTFKRSAINQRGEIVVECLAHMLVAMRP